MPSKSCYQCGLPAVRGRVEGRLWTFVSWHGRNYSIKLEVSRRTTFIFVMHWFFRMQIHVPVGASLSKGASKPPGRSNKGEEEHKLTWISIMRFKIQLSQQSQYSRNIPSRFILCYNLKSLWKRALTLSTIVSPAHLGIWKGQNAHLQRESHTCGREPHSIPLHELESLLGSHTCQGRLWLRSWQQKTGSCRRCRTTSKTHPRLVLNGWNYW